MKKKLIVKDIVGPYGGTYEDGVKLYREIDSLLKDSQRVELDFEGIELASSSFFNGTIGKLFQEFAGGTAQLPVSFLNLTSRDEFVLDHTRKALALVNEGGIDS